MTCSTRMMFLSLLHLKLLPNDQVSANIDINQNLSNLEKTDMDGDDISKHALLD